LFEKKKEFIVSMWRLFISGCKAGDMAQVIKECQPRSPEFKPQDSQEEERRRSNQG
jgi:hypothetical protein